MNYENYYFFNYCFNANRLHDRSLTYFSPYLYTITIKSSCIGINDANVRQFYFWKSFFAKIEERKGMGSIYFPLGLIVKTAQGACLKTNSATLPMVKRFHPL